MAELILCECCGRTPALRGIQIIVEVTDMRDGFHWSCGMYFRRLQDGTVEVTQTKNGGKTDDIEWQREIPPSEWASIVAAVSSTGSPAPTEKRGQLNPAHSRWLMGYPAEWDTCAPTRNAIVPQVAAEFIAALKNRLMKTVGDLENMALDQQETFDQLVRQNNAYRECLDRIRVWLTPGREGRGELMAKGRMDMLDEVRSALEVV